MLTNCITTVYNLIRRVFYLHFLCQIQSTNSSANVLLTTMNLSKVTNQWLKSHQTTLYTVHQMKLNYIKKCVQTKANNQIEKVTSVAFFICPQLYVNHTYGRITRTLKRRGIFCIIYYYPF